MPSKVKKLMADVYRKHFVATRYFFVANVKSITGREDNRLRLDVKKNDVEIEMLKNRVVRRVLIEGGLEALAKIVEGQVVVFTGKDPIKTAKAAVDAQKTLKNKLKLRGGWMDGKTLTAKDVETLASIPAKEVLYSMLVGAVQAPLRRLVTVLNALPQKLVIVLKKVSDKAVEKAPVTEKAPAAEKAPVTEKAPAAEKAPVAEKAPAEEKPVEKPAEKLADAPAPKPAEEKKPGDAPQASAE
jgi:large subunit ribosomal protein L10